MKKNYKQGILIFAAIAFCCATLPLGILGYLDYSLLSRGKETPQRITAADLAAKGPGDNIHLEVVEFRLSQSYVFEEENGRWDRVWIGLLPIDQQEEGPVRVMLRSDSAKSEGDLKTLEDRGALRGVIVDSINSIDSDVGASLSQYFPGIDLTKVMIFAPDRDFPKATAVYAFLGSAALSLVIGIACIVGAIVVSQSPGP